MNPGVTILTNQEEIAVTSDERMSFKEVVALYKHLGERMDLSDVQNTPEICTVLRHCRESIQEYINERWGYDGIERLWEEL